MDQHNTNTDFTDDKVLIKKLTQQILQIRDNQKSENIICCYLILNNIKIITDIAGKDVTETLINHFFQKLSPLQCNPTLCTSLSNDHYIFYFSNIHEVDLKAFCNDICTQLSETANEVNLPATLNYSMGIVSYHNEETTAEILIQNAKYSALLVKDSADIRYKICDYKDECLLTRQARLAKDLSHAIDKNQIMIFYQPQFDLQKNHLIGYEALVRWYHHDYKNIEAEEIIQIAEQNKSIVILGRYMQKAALTQYAEWTKWYKQPLKIALNASLLELVSDSYAENLLSLTQELRLNISQIEIEITESHAPQLPELFTNAISKLRATGCLIALDDFGTGHSSLERAKQLNIDLIKIDKAFVNDITYKKADRDFLATIIQLCDSLHIPTLIEGVTRKEQIEILKTLGCKYAQGYYYSEALSTTDMEAFLKKQNNPNR